MHVPESREMGRGGTLGHMRRVAGVLVSGVVAFLAVSSLLSPGTAGATALLLESTPADGQSLQRLDQIVFEFDSLLLANGAEVTVTNLGGTAVAVETSVDGSRLTGVVVGEVPSGNYEVAYRVQSSDGSVNEGSIRVGVDSPSQALSGGLLAVIAISAGLVLYLTIVFVADKRRRPNRRLAQGSARGDAEVES